MSQIVKLALEDGTIFTGRGFGASGEVYGEVCFNTSLTGYQEILTDPSYCGQIVTMTYPLIGNYGINPEDVESRGMALSGFVVRELCHTPSNYRSTQSLHDYLKEGGVVGIEGIDTRALVRRLRIRGAMTGLLSTIDADDESLRRKVRACPGLVGRDLIREVLPEKTFTWEQGLSKLSELNPGSLRKLSQAPHVVAIDYGMKWSIARHLLHSGCRVSIMPGTASAEEVLALKPDGVFLSNGPGDPRPLDYAINTVRDLLGKTPVFGICHGHQLLGMAAQCEIFKLKFGHRGGNHPVLNHQTGQVEITSQNHGFALSPDSLPSNIEVTHINLNDQTVEGIRLKDVPAFSVQYHPEAAAGPHDSRYLFDDFLKLMGV